MEWRHPDTCPTGKMVQFFAPTSAHQYSHAVELMGPVLVGMKLGGDTFKIVTMEGEYIALDVVQALAWAPLLDAPEELPEAPSAEDDIAERMDAERQAQTYDAGIW